MKPTIIIEEERRRLISRRTKAALAVRKAQGMKLGGLNARASGIVTRRGSVRNCCGRSLPNWQACPHARLPVS